MVEIAESGAAQFAPLYPADMPLFEKINTIATRIYRADEAIADKSVRDQLHAWETAGFGNLPVCMAKTQYQLHHRSRPARRADRATRCRCARSGWRPGAGFVVAICGEIMTMPGLPKVPIAGADPARRERPDRRTVLGAGQLRGRHRVDKRVETIAGDTPGLTYSFPVYRFAGRRRGAPRAYLQAALHGDELPGTVALDRLMERLRQADAEGRIAGPITVVPGGQPDRPLAKSCSAPRRAAFTSARAPISTAISRCLRSRISAFCRCRDPGSADQRLKRRLLELSIGADIVLDLHCDDEGLPYLYAPAGCGRR